MWGAATNALGTRPPHHLFRPSSGALQGRHNDAPFRPRRPRLSSSPAKRACDGCQRFHPCLPLRSSERWLPDARRTPKGSPLHLVKARRAAASLKRLEVAEGD